MLIENQPRIIPCHVSPSMYAQKDTYVRVLHTTSIRFYISLVPRPDQTYTPHAKSILRLWIRDGGWTKFCQLKTIHGIVEIATAFALYATSPHPPAPTFQC